nr:UDP-sugar pyrophosphorylase [Ipomoea batatas]
MAADGISKLSIDGDEWASSAPNLQSNLSLFSPQQVELAKILLEAGQSHLFQQWPQPGVDDNEKRAFFDQVPSGENLTYGDESFVKFEEAGIREARKAAFVLVAGGLGERLGYNGIKVKLSTFIFRCPVVLCSVCIIIFSLF